MSKMFVHFSGTIAEFKSAGNESKYNNHIVFIKGGTEGTGEAVYTHGQYYANVKEALEAIQEQLNNLKYFSKISDGTNIASVGSANGTITFSATDPGEVSVDVDTTGVKIGLSEAFKELVNTTLPGNISAVDAKLGAKNAAAATGEEATAFARIKNLEEVVSQITGTEGDVESVETQITNAINALDVAISEGDYVASIKQEDGKIVATTGTFNFDEAGAAATAQAAAAEDATTKANAAKEAAIADAESKYQVKGDYEAAGAAAAVDTKLTAEVERAQAAEKANADAIAVEKGRLDVFLADADITEKAVDTLKEIQEYITSDGEAAAIMTSNIAAAQSAADKAQEEVNALEEVVANVRSTADAAATQVALDTEIARAGAAEKANQDAIDAIEADYLKAADKTELSDAIAAEKNRAEGIESGLNTRLASVEADYLKSADKTELQNSIDAKVSQNAYDEKIAALEAKDQELEDMWAWEEI